MPEFLVTSIGTFECAIRADLVLRTVAVAGVSRPLRAQRPDLVAVAVDGSISYFSDLGVRLGIAEPVAGGAVGLVLAESGSVAGIVLPAAPRSITAADDRTIPVESRQRALPVSGCLRGDGRLIPILGETLLSSLAEPDAGTWSITLPEPTGERDDSLPGAAVVVAGRRLAVRGAVQSAARSAAQSAKSAAKPAQSGAQSATELVRLPGATPPLAGIAPYEGELHPVVDVAVALGLDASDGPSELLACREGDSTLLLRVDAVAEPPTDGLLAPLPPLLAGVGVRDAVLSEDSLVPVVDPFALAGGATDQGLAYETGSRFAERFLRADVEVRELAFGDSVYAIPERELTLLDTASRPVPFGSPNALVRGALPVDGRVVPVLDLGAYLGHPGERTDAGPFLLVTDGTFEAIVVPDEDLGTRALDPAVQKPLPLVAERPVVHGCYVDADEVRLVLNVALIALHARDPAVRHALAGLAGAAGSPGSPSPVSIAPRAAAAEQPPGAPSMDGPTMDEPVADAPPSEGPPTDEPVTEVPPAADRSTPPAPRAVSPPSGEAPLRATDADAPAPDRERPDAPPAPGARSPRPAADTPASDERRSGPDERDAAVRPAEETSPDGRPTRGDVVGSKARPVPGDAVGPEGRGGRDLAAPGRRPRPRRRALALILALLVLLVLVGVVFLPDSLPRIDRRAAEGLPSDQGALEATTGREGEEPVSTGPAMTTLRVYFEPDAAALTTEARSALEAFASGLSPGDAWVIECTGHTARVGSEASSLALSRERARSVAAYLGDLLDLPDERLVVHGAGASEPVASNAYEAGRVLNRRVEIVARRQDE